MDTRVSTRTRLSLLPVFIALIFNLVAPIVSVAAPGVIPEPFGGPDVAVAADPSNEINFTLEGCRLEAATLDPVTNTCSAYTSGNLGKLWAELDLVPYRLTVRNGGSTTQTFTIALAADNELSKDGVSFTGYDVITDPVTNLASVGELETCTISSTSDNAFTAGDIGGVDKTIYQLVTITISGDSTCAFDYAERLSIEASEGFSGSSLGSQLLKEDLSSIGQRTVTINPKEILPQGLAKTMTATQGQTHTWTIQKATTTPSLNFANTCSPTPGALSAAAQVMVTWTRSAATGSGAATITTSITATNPSHRTITVNVSDQIYAGTGTASPVGSPFTASEPIEAGTSHTFTHSTTVTSTATMFHDIATATYTDLLTGVPVTGTTTATASADVVASTAPAANASAVIVDTETIDGAGLSFSVDSTSGASGSFTSGGSPYVLGTETTNPVVWTSSSQSASGSVTFNKTVSLDEPREIAAGAMASLDDTAQLTGSSGFSASDSLSIPITAEAAVSLTISKTIPNILTGSEEATFTFDITGPSGPLQRTLTFTAGETAESVTITDLDPGTYTVHEQPVAGWTVQTDKTVNLNLPNCSGTAAFVNSFGAATAQVRKVTVPAGSEADWKFFLNGPGATNLEVTTSGTDFVVFPLNLQEGSYVITEQAKDGWNQTDAAGCSFTVDYPADAGEIFSCTITNAAVGVSISKTNEEESDDGFVVRGQEIDFSVSVTVTNGPADDVVVTDTLPDGLTYVGGSGVPTPVSVVGQVITWNVLSLGTGTHEFTYTARVDPDAEGTLENVACVDSDDSVEICDTSEVEVTPPTVAILKVNNATGTVTRGSTVGYTLTVTVTNGPAHEVLVTDTLPTGIVYKVGTAVPSIGFSVSLDGRTLTWNAGTLNGDADGTAYPFTYDGLVSTTAPLNTNIVNVGCVAASDDANDDEPPICRDSTIRVTPPAVTINKTSNFEGLSVLRGQEITFGISVNVTDGPMHDVVVTDTLPAGLTYVTGSASPPASNVAGQILTWEFAELSGIQAISYRATVSATATGTLANLACVDTDEIDALLCDQTTTTVRIPTLFIDKVASTETITISGPNDALVATPSVVTWTLSYTLTNGPVTGAVITDQVPVGFTFLDAAGGTFANGTVTWNLGTVSASGSVTFRTTVNPATISRTGPTVNTAVIDSNETSPDDGQDSVTVTVTPPVLAGNPPPPPAPVLPNTATGFGLDGTPVSVPIELLVAFFIGSLGALTLASARTRSRRR